MRAAPFVRDGQRGWAHDEGHAAGTFHTFDALDPGGGPPRKIHLLIPRSDDSVSATSQVEPGGQNVVCPSCWTIIGHGPGVRGISRWTLRGGPPPGSRASQV